MTTEDADLVKQLKDPTSKNEAFRVLLSLYKERLYYQIRSIVYTHDDTDDILQETFIKIYNNIDTFKENSSLFSWMYRIATNQALDFLKSKSRIQRISTAELNELTIDQLQADSLFDGEAAEILLQKAINTLPEKQQLVFKMRYYQELDYESLSEILDTSVGALKASYHHAVKKIEQYLQNN
ncbi:RNA polymerase sigma factor [Myroides pelagicus]|uniref:Sigma-70 family RNA polymerase sigma factor n=1 Tax=Myroides pelagicus TaxID=270914 RepID=A0A7K1GQT4_9FLAO|nr:RNA polymerase sigma factor [Myroides pelagicus]MEC4114982.1 RNA polymerase sigma factor [Myroides pelagicus]MTH30693.1 sigma-70 family RNA polymerase sigma factor [Myroides pelagicus]